jgi:hypothetical protein
VTGAAAHDHEETTMLDRERAIGFAESWCDAWNRRDVEAILSHYAEDAALNSPLVAQRFGVADGWIRGKARLRENFTIGLRTQGMHFSLETVLFGQQSFCVLYRRETGTLVSDLFEIDAEGLALRVVACHGG